MKELPLCCGNLVCCWFSRQKPTNVDYSTYIHQTVVAERETETQEDHILKFMLMWFLFRVCESMCRNMCVCMLIYLTVSKCVLSSHHTPSALALSRRRGERSGQGQPRPLRLRGTVSSFGQGKQTGLASGQGGLSGVAVPGQGIAWDRTGWDGRPLIDAGHYFHPRKLGQLQTERCHGNWGMGSRAEGFSSQLAQPHLSTQPHKSAHTHGHKYTSTQVNFLTFD